MSIFFNLLALFALCIVLIAFTIRKTESAMRIRALEKNQIPRIEEYPDEDESQTEIKLSDVDILEKATWDLCLSINAIAFSCFMIDVQF